MWQAGDNNDPECDHPPLRSRHPDAHTDGYGTPPGDSDSHNVD
jgi:hypothetical protein